MADLITSLGERGVPGKTTSVAQREEISGHQRMVVVVIKELNPFSFNASDPIAFSEITRHLMRNQCPLARP